MIPHKQKHVFHVYHERFWMKHLWKLYELEYILEKIDLQDSHYDPLFFHDKEHFYVDHVKSSYMLEI